MRRLDKDTAVNLGLAILGGLLLRWSFGLQPVWWLAWVAPAPLLAALLRSGDRTALGLALLAGLIAATGSLHYMTLFQPLAPALLVTLLLALSWVLVLGQARRIMLRWNSPWAVLAYPLMCCALDTLLAHLHPDSNWGSLAHSQGSFPPALQIVSVLGMAGLVFVLSLLPAALALAAVRGLRAARWPLLASFVLALACIGFGFARIPAAAPAQGELIGMAVIDDFIGPRVAPAKVERIWAQYERHVEALASQGARLVLLPEKISVLAPPDAARLRERMAALARRTKVWLALGIGIDEGKTTNHLWLFNPDGLLGADYLKHHLAPPERSGYVAGSRFDIQAIAGVRYALAICKDMHFATDARDYAALNAQALLVPAWDFGEDGLYAARQSGMRSVETGMPMLRASREGRLTIADAYGRVLQETPSAELPGATLLGRAPAPLASATIYSRTGDVFGWLCTVAALLLAVRYRRKA